MDIFYAICVGIITAAIATVAVFAVKTLVQVRQTAKAVEYLAINANDRIEATRGIFDAVDHVTGFLRSGWFKAFQIGAHLFSGGLGLGSKGTGK